jgi:cytochrome c oxidase subunit 2
LRVLSSLSCTLRRRGALLLALLTAGAGWSLTLAPSAMANCCAVKSGGSPNADAIHSLYVIVLIMAIVVFVVVEGALAYAVFKFRAKKHPVADQIHGHTQLEIGWTLGAAFILVVLSVVTFIKLPAIINPPNSSPEADQVLSASLTQPNPPDGHKLTVCVVGRQFIWRYTYGNGCNKNYFEQQLPYSFQEMVVPAGEVVDLLIQSSDVIHAWWVPSLGGKVDAVPGYTTYTWFKAPKAGALFHGQCAQLCGRQHAFMTALVKVVTPTQYEQWLSQQRRLIAAQNNQVADLRQQLIQKGELTPSGNF